MSSKPLYPPPPGVESDWSQAGWAPAIEGECIALTVVITLCVTARLYTRLHILHHFGLDDCFCILAFIAATNQLAWQFVAIRYGFGRHIWDIPKSNAPWLYKSFFMLELLPGTSYFFVKMTLLLTYARIFNPTRHMRWLIRGGMVVCTLFYVGAFLFTLLACHPIAKSWNPALKGTCAKEAIPGSPTGIFNIISDVYICVLPMPMVWKLNMRWPRKLKLMSVFSLGLFTVAMSIARFVETVVQNHEIDFTYHYGITDILANLEYTVGLMVACMIVCPAFWERVLRQPLSTAYRSVTSVLYHDGAPRGSETHRASDSEAQLTEIVKTTTVSQEHGAVSTTWRVSPLE